MKSTSRFMGSLLIGSLLSCISVAMITTAGWAAPPDHAPAYGYRAKHRYVYYPEREIYYAPESRLWFWISGGDWRFGAALPGAYQQYTSGGVSIELASDRPYTEHVHVVERYGKGPKHKKSKHKH